MAMILRRVLKSVKNRSNSKSNSSESQDSVQSSSSSSSSRGVFDQIPSDVFMQILMLLGPKEAAKASIVCKSWKFMVSDNRLWIFFLQNQQESWESIVFAENHLRSGYPLQTLYNQPMSLPFMHIYGQRAQVTGSVIIDGGSGYCKFGWSKYACPSGRSATFLEFGDMESPMYSRLRHFFATIYSRMQMKPSTQPLVVSIPICHYYDTESSKASRRQLKEAIYRVLFDMNVPAVCSINQAVLALYAASRTSGIVVNIGFRVTSIVPIFQGKVMHQVGIEVVGQGALTLTGFLKELMDKKSMNVESLYTIRTLKENLCYVAADYETELSKDTHASYEVLGEGQFTLSEERFQTGEILFQPRMGRLRMMGLHQAVALCMDHCQAAKETDDDDGWFKTVVLAGGTACLPGLPERLDKELRGLLSPSISNDIKVIPPPYGVDSVWIGAKLVSNVSTFHEAWCMTKKQFRRKYRRNIIRS
ncbi:F-box domain [Macleaya cordata]|uniref:F-box domain n=1 Tax=Macleaya cordata TaxID=56857 RepID=A0A200PT49_MACCD|nr:F-box domain [Macleaya cordata]